MEIIIVLGALFLGMVVVAAWRSRDGQPRSVVTMTRIGKNS